MLREKKQNKTVFSKLVQISLTVAVVACTKQVVGKAGHPSNFRNSSNGQCLKIVNGIEVDNVVLTASHCTENTASGNVELDGGTKAVAMVRGWTVEDKKETLEYENGSPNDTEGPIPCLKDMDRPSRDIAVLIFPSGTSSKFWKKPKVKAPILTA